MVPVRNIPTDGVTIGGKSPTAYFSADLEAPSLVLFTAGHEAFHALKRTNQLRAATCVRAINGFILQHVIAATQHAD